MCFRILRMRPPVLVGASGFRGFGFFLKGFGDALQPLRLLDVPGQPVAYRPMTLLFLRHLVFQVAFEDLVGFLA